MRRIIQQKTMLPAVSFVLGVALLLTATNAYADTTYTSGGVQYNVPSGYQAYTTGPSGTSGIYYNSSTGEYFNPVTGQRSMTAPTGPASMTNGQYNIPSGYTISSHGTYYNVTTGMYYDPATGFTSTSAPAGPVFVANTVSTSGTATPGLPNTGAGGMSEAYIAWLAVLALVVIGAGVVLLRRGKKDYYVGQ